MSLVFINIILDVEFTVPDADITTYFVNAINSEFDDRYSLIRISKNVDFSLINCNLNNQLVVNPLSTVKHPSGSFIKLDQ